MTTLRFETFAIPPVFDPAQPLPGISDSLSADMGSFQDALTRARSSASPPSQSQERIEQDPPQDSCQDDPGHSDRQPAHATDDRQQTADATPRCEDLPTETDGLGNRSDATANAAERTDPQAEGETEGSAPEDQSEDEEPEDLSAAMCAVVAEVPSAPKPNDADGTAPADTVSALPPGKIDAESTTSKPLAGSDMVEEATAGEATQRKAQAEPGEEAIAMGETVPDKSTQQVAGLDAKVLSASSEAGAIESTVPRRPGRSRDGNARRAASADAREASPAGQRSQSATGGTDEVAVAQQQQQQVHSELATARQAEPPPAQPSPQIAAAPSESPAAEKLGMPAAEGDAAAPARKSADAASRSSAATADRDMPASDQVDRVRFVQRVARAFESVGERGGSLRLRLHPPELGSLRLDVTVRNGAMTAKLEAETPAAQSLLLDNLPMLRERLAEQNIRIERFDVDLMDRSAGGSPGPSGGDASPRDRHDQQPRHPRGGSEGRLEDAAPRRGPIRSATPGRFDVII